MPTKTIKYYYLLSPFTHSELQVARYELGVYHLISEAKADCNSQYEIVGITL